MSRSSAVPRLSRAGRLAAGVGVALLILCSGCGRRSLSDERNVYYVRGMRLREQERFAEAADAFRACLRLSPDSAKAHLQLALLYEGPLNDPLRCVFHYREFLESRPDDPHAPAVREWQARAERRLIEDLRSSAAAVAPEPAARPLPAAAGTAAGEQEDEEESEDTSLLARIRELNTLNQALRDRLRALAARTHPGGSGSAGTAEPGGTARSAPEGSAPPAEREQADASPPAAAADPVRSHRVVAGDTLSSLSRRYYGSAAHWAALRDYNRAALGGSEVLRLGIVLYIPPLEVLNHRKGEGEDHPTAPGER
ncbi:MAG: LysM peptidoglycan-binding domain-containing protein [Lentisphaeria bacterium]|nr:LysM peptidoglycan-binding domain-containing protein [Lentisphaeria bacterium]